MPTASLWDKLSDTKLVHADIEQKRKAKELLTTPNKLIKK